ncbi:hypothetical protein [Micromonospora endophytica]|uniref:Uncharacterized protein n=1 Tax=Micromonospora endophytica TaxID=515350 RepID=A0A2W2D475_9ACTN|nr:hypothetical protein [Micromonospora endophytica]PZF98448.1 hypothetical protein C1I93_08950 [Micromonospora endophytica]RIW50874.1 hypothetical protein D3H59_01840 [Micromonospora endophytica]BCJ60616.1 hypothetical protein Jiend_40380 [Micromonospora endophytica]
MKRLWTPAWIARHVAMVVLVTSFLGLGWWQVSRAAAGNAISWGYAVEWPIFAGFVVFVWWREVRHTVREGPAADADRGTNPQATAAGEPSTVAPAGARTGQGGTDEVRPRTAIRRPVRVTRVAVDDGGDDADLAAYNRYLSWLNANPGAKPGDYPG